MVDPVASGREEVSSLTCLMGVLKALGKEKPQGVAGLITGFMRIAGKSLAL